MKGGFKIVGILSVTLLMCVLIGQGSWLIKIREVKRQEFRHLISFNLTAVVDEFLSAEYFDPLYNFSSGLAADGKTFIWGKKNDSIKISSYCSISIIPPTPNKSA